MRVLSVVGARPQFVKLAPVDAALVRAGAAHRIVHTGQHYDVRMSEVFFDELAIPEPDVHLAIGSGPHGVQTGAMLSGVERVLLEDPPDWVLVYGDTNSTLAGALAAVKLELPVAHLEAGLRSFNRRMPEEHNRVLTDHAADLLLAPSVTALTQLEHEGLGARTHLVGDVMVDILLRVRDEIDRQPVVLDHPVFAADYAVATVHRAENTDDDRRLARILTGLSRLPVPVALLAHPRLVARAERFGLDLSQGAIEPLPPLPYRAMVSAVRHAAAVVTDSGGLQKEAFLLEVPCATVREETEWVETLEAGWNVLVPDPLDLPARALRGRPSSPSAHPYGQGRASEAVVTALRQGPPTAGCRPGPGRGPA